MMIYIYVFVALFISGIDSKDIENKLMEYFDGDSVKLINKEWWNRKTAYENAVLVTIAETYGYKDMNVYVRKTQSPLKLSNGYLHSDNQVQIFLQDLELEELPHLRMPEVAFNLPSNVLQIESTISKMIVNAKYMVFRNKSDIIYSLQDQDPNQNSPFRFQQVKTVGQLAIVIEGCTFTGIFVTVLNGHTVNLGHDVMGLSKCLYTFEISTPGFGGPPVIVRYNTKGKGLSLQHLLMKPLRNELLPKLQAAMFNYINTSAIFGDSFPQIRNQQRNIFSAVSNYINEAVREYNKITVKKNQGIVEMEDFFIKWDDALEGDSNSSVIRLSKMVLSGLDSMYSAHIGGPYKISGIKIGEEIRFDFLQIRGEAYFGNEVTNGSYDFSVEIRDVAAYVLVGIELEQHGEGGIKILSNSKSMKKFQIVGWRTIEFAIPGIAFMSTESFITGYLLNALPNYLVTHVHQVYREVTNQENEKEVQKLGDASSRNVDNISYEENINDDQNNVIGSEKEGEHRQSEENNDNNKEKASDVEEDQIGLEGSNENNDNNEEKASDVEEDQIGTVGSNENIDNNEENISDANEDKIGLKGSNENVDLNDENASDVEEDEIGLEGSNDNNDDDKEHVSDAAEDVVEPEKPLGSTEDGAEDTKHGTIGDENKNLENDPLNGLSESLSDEVDKHVISRQRLIKRNNKKQSNKTKTVRDNEV